MTKKRASRSKLKLDARNRVQSLPAPSSTLLNDLKVLIEQARGRVAQQINAELVLLNWHIGNRIKTEVLQDERAEYGKSIIEALADDLTLQYGRGYSRTMLLIWSVLQNCSQTRKLSTH